MFSRSQTNVRGPYFGKLNDDAQTPANYLSQKTEKTPSPLYSGKLDGEDFGAESGDTIIQKYFPSKKDPQNFKATLVSETQHEVRVKPY